MSKLKNPSHSPFTTLRAQFLCSAVTVTSHHRITVYVPRPPPSPARLTAAARARQIAAGRGSPTLATRRTAAGVWVESGGGAADNVGVRMSPDARC